MLILNCDLEYMNTVNIMTRMTMTRALYICEAKLNPKEYNMK